MGIKNLLIRFFVILLSSLTPVISYASTDAHKLDWTGFYYRVFVFVIFVAILVYLLRKPILKMLTGKRDAVQSSLTTAINSKSDAEALLKDYQLKMIALETDLLDLRRESLSLAEADGQMMIEDAKLTVEKMKHQATTMIENELNKARLDLRNEVTLIAMDNAKKELIKNAKGEKGKKIMTSYIKRIGA